MSIERNHSLYPAWREIFNTLSDAAIAADMRGQIIFANPAAEKLLGWRVGELLGQSLNVIQPLRMREIHNQAFDAFVQRGHLQSLAGRAVRLPAQRRDGSEIDIELTLTTLKQPGDPIVVGVLRDLSDRVELERQLQVTEQLRAVTSLATELATIADLSELLQTAAAQLAEKLGLTAVGIWWQADTLHQACSETMSHINDENQITSRFASLREARRLESTDDWLAWPATYGSILPVCSEGSCDGMLVVFYDQYISDELLEVLNAFASLLNGILGNEVKLRREQEARRNAEQAQAHLTFLDQASEQLISSPDLAERQQLLVRSCVPSLGDWAGLYMTNPGASDPSKLKVASVFHAQQEETAGLKALLSRVGVQAKLRLAEVMQQQRPVVVVVEESFAHFALVLPLQARGRLIGALVVGSLRTLPGETQLRVGNELARHAALALDNVRLWDDQRRSSQDSLEASAMLRAFFEAAPIARAFLDTKLRLVKANQSMLTLLERAIPNDLQQQFPLPVQSLLPQVEESVWTQLKNVLRKGEAITDLELRTERGGLVRHWLLHAQSVKVADKTKGLGISMVEITARKQFEADLRHSRDQLAAILTGVADGIVVQDRRGRAVFANPSALALLGYNDLRQLQAVSLRHIVQQLDIRDEHDKPLPVWRLPGAQLRQGREASEALVHLRNREGTIDRWFAVQATDVRDGAGRLDLVINIFRDVTESRRHQQRSDFLAASSAMLGESLNYEQTLRSVARLAIPKMADWCAVDVLEKDQDYTSEPKRLAVAHIDPAKIELAKKLAKQNVYDANVPQGVAAVLRSGQAEMITHISPEMLEAVAAGRDEEYKQLVKDLDLRSYLCVPMRSQGKVLGALTWVYAESGRHYNAEDLRLAEEVASRAAMAIENARLYQHAQDSVREREDFLAVASHELRTPVTVIRAYSQLLTRQLQGNRDRLDYDRIEQHTSNIDKGAIRLTGLIEQLLDITSLQADDERLSLVSLSLGELLESVVEDAQTLQQRGLHAGINVRLEVSDELHGFWDASRLQRVFSNLIDNALKYSARGDEVVIRAWGENVAGKERVHVTISDSGIGVPAEQQHTIFEPFKRGSNASTRNYSGFGMGLAVCRQIVDVHGGRIWVDSRGDGLGSVFHVSLPRETEQAEVASHEVASDEVASNETS